MDIIGFDAQISAPKRINKLTRAAARPVAVTRTVARPVAARPVARPVAVTRTVARPVAARPVARPVAVTRTVARPVAVTRTVARPTGMRPNVRLSKPVTKFAPAQVLYKRTAQPVARPVAKQPMAIVKPSGAVIPVQNKAIPVSSLTATTTPSTVMAVSPVQRSFMPVDLPYQTPTAKSKIVRLTNTPFAYAVNIDMIEPAVDSGSGNYYGK